MEALVYLFSWGSPLGLGAFFCLMGVGAGVFFWGASHLNKHNASGNE